jgi:hypothetical protein
MGRGLSDLQRYIVAKAATVERLYYADILQEHFGWQPVFRPRDGYDKATRTPKYEIGQQRFDPERIGRTRYHQTMVTLSRAADRLQQRGLVTCLVAARSHWSAVEITPEGKRLAATWH